MKKRIIALFCAMLVVTCLSGCSTTETIRNETTKKSVGSYSIFRTSDVQEYLSFLEEFDETKFEIVDISTCMKITLQGPNEFYIVTYRTLSK